MNGTLYGTTGGGGANGLGTVFSIDTKGSEKVVYSFGSGSDGISPVAPLIAVKHTLYGTTYEGGISQNPNCASAGCGTIFALIPPAQPGDAWAKSILHTFTGSDQDGARAMAALTAGPHGVLYGTTYSGGAGGIGTVFQITP